MFQREQVAFEIGLVKKKDGLPVTDRARERKVKESYSRRAAEKGCDEVTVKRIAELLVSDAVKLQNRRVKKDLEGKVALVVGGSGRMGAWFCRRLSNRGARVSVWDPRGRLDGYDNVKNIAQIARDADIIVVSSPLGVAPAELKLVLQARPSGLVFDVCSVKSHIARQLRSAAKAGIKVASIHPMFGPNVPTPNGRNVIICDCGSRDGTSLAQKLVSGAGANIVRISLEEHDELMAYVLGLAHINTLLFATTLSQSKKPLNDFARVQGPSFERMVAASRDLSNESVRVYHDIQSLNPHTRQMFSKFVNIVKLLNRISIQREPAEFRKLMESNKKYLEVTKNG